VSIDPKTTAVVLIEYRNGLATCGGVLHEADEFIEQLTSWR